MADYATSAFPPIATTERTSRDVSKLQALAHVVVENQVVLGEAMPVPETLNRLMDEELDHHEAVHAICSILLETIFVNQTMGRPSRWRRTRH